MNAMINALRESGVPVPTVKYRIWNWLRDHPEKTSDDIERALGLNYPPSAALRDMEEAGTVKVFSDMSKTINPVTRQPYKVKRFSVVNKDSFDETVRKPYPKRAPKAKPDLYSVRVQPQPIPTERTFNPEAHVSKLSLGDCKALYVYLHSVFK